MDAYMNHPGRALTALTLSVCLAANSATPAEALEEAIRTQIENQKAGALSQEKIDTWSDQSRQLLEEYRNALRETESLKAYNTHLKQLLASQQQEKASMEKQLQEVEGTARGLVPLMLRMEESLEDFVRLDLPFLPEEREQRLANLKAIMARADVTDAEKFRRLLEAFQVENKYGQTIEAYRAELKIGDQTRTVDYLRVGRVTLFYQTLDGHESGVWNAKTHQWQNLPSSFNKELRKGLAIARKESAPDLIKVMVPPPEVVR
jgi:exonuclease VII large subunit